MNSSDKLIIILCSVLIIFISPCINAQNVKQRGIASYYADKFEGRLTANGEKYRHSKLTAAHKTLPFGTIVKVTNISNGKTINVKINDRGPYVENRILDLSKLAAEKLDFIHQGLTEVEIVVVDPGDGKSSNINADLANVDKQIENREFYTLNVLRIDPAGYGVQIGTFGEAANLVRLTNNLKTSYQQQVMVQVTLIDRNKVYRIIVGNLKKRVKAEKLKNKLEKKYPGCFVVHLNKR